MTSTSPHVPAVDASRVDWAAIQMEWRDREYEALFQAVSGLEGVAVDAIDDLLVGAARPTNESARAALDRAFAAAAKHEDGELMLALYVHGRCLEKWERTEDYERIRTVLRALDEATRVRRSDGGLLPLVVTLATVIVDAMGVEDALSCSCPVALGERSTAIVALVERVLAQEIELEGGPAGARALVRSDAETTRSYFDKLTEVAAAVLSFVEEDAPGPAPYLDHAVQALEVGLEGDVYESELRAHRACLEALQQRAIESRLRVDAGELVYLYPFALDGVDQKKAVERDSVDRAVAGLASIGLDSAAAHELDLNDLWDRSDAPEAGYAGVAIELPSVTVETTAYETLSFRSEVRLSRLGNHHVRVWSRVGGEGLDAGLHTINQALRRGSHAMGEEQLRSESGSWKKFPRYAEDVVGAIATAMSATAVTNPSARFHAVLGARSISVQHPDGRITPASADEVERSVGASLLFHPVRHLATALDEWIRYPAPSVRNLLAAEGYAGDLVVRTDNTTVNFMSDSPEWLIDEYEEMIEFVASLPPLFTLWERQASELARKLDELLSKQQSIHELHGQELSILALEQSIRRQLAMLHSPALCRTRAQREFLDALSNAAGMAALENGLEMRLTLLADRQARISALVRRTRQEQDDRRSGRIEIVLGVLAAASLAGVVQWVNDTFGVESRAWHWGEALMLLAITLAITLYIVSARRSR